MNRDLQGDCIIGVRQVYDIKTERGKFWDDYNFFLEYCSLAGDSSSCQRISKGYPKNCARSCFLKTSEFKNFTLKIDGDIFVLDMKVKMKPSYNTLYFRLAMVPIDADNEDSMRWSKHFPVRQSICSSIEPVKTIKTLKVSELINKTMNLSFTVDPSTVGERFNFAIDMDNWTSEFISIHIENVWAKKYRQNLDYESVLEPLTKSEIFDWHVDGGAIDSWFFKRRLQSKIGRVILTNDATELQKNGFDHGSDIAYQTESFSVVPGLEGQFMHLTFSTSATIVLSNYSFPSLKPGKWYLSVVIDSPKLPQTRQGQSKEGKSKDPTEHEWQKFNISFEEGWRTSKGELIGFYIILPTVLCIVILLLILVSFVFPFCYGCRCQSFHKIFEDFKETFTTYVKKTWHEPTNSYLVFLLSIYLALPLGSSLYGNLEKQSKGDLDVCFYNTKCFFPHFRNIPLNSVLSSLSHFIVGLIYLLFVLAFPKGKGGTGNVSGDDVNNNQEGDIGQATVARERKLKLDDDKRYRSVGLTLMFRGIFLCVYNLCPTTQNLFFVQAMTIYLLNMACNYVDDGIISISNKIVNAKEPSHSLLEGVLPSLLLARFGSDLSNVHRGMAAAFILLWKLPILYRYGSFFHAGVEWHSSFICNPSNVIKCLMFGFAGEKKSSVKHLQGRKAFVRAISLLMIFTLFLALWVKELRMCSAVYLAYGSIFLLSLLFLEHAHLRKKWENEESQSAVNFVHEYGLGFVISYGPLFPLIYYACRCYDFASPNALENSVDTYDFRASQSQCLLKSVFLGSMDMFHLLSSGVVFIFAVRLFILTRPDFDPVLRLCRVPSPHDDPERREADVDGDGATELLTIEVSVMENGAQETQQKTIATSDDQNSG